ncbi:MAG: ATP-binding protein [Methylophilaceae bacterium]
MLDRLLAIPYPWELSLMLLTLHAALLADPGSGLALAALTAHYGLFLLWQPIWRTEEQLSPATAGLFLVGGIVLVAGISPWFFAFWLALLIGLLGGRVSSSKAAQERTAYLMAAIYLIGMLLIWVEPRLLTRAADTSNLNWLAEYVLPLLPACLLFLKTVGSKDPTGSLDFFYSLMLFLLTLILVLGSFVIESVAHIEYSIALLRVLFSIALALLALSWLWDPRAGFSGLGQLLSRYLLSVGMPFEQWLHRVAASAENENSASEFLNAAVDELQTLPWVMGGTWRTEAGRGMFGVTSNHRAEFTYRNFSLTLFTRWRLSPALILHIKLLVQILGEFYESKLREEQMRSVAYMQAVYETGARLTHDIKNLLQSLSVLCVAAEREGDDQALVALIQRQLPQLTQRLQVTLNKLQAPKTAAIEMVNATTWWKRLRQRYKDSEIEFSSHRIPAGTEVPVELFDSVAENLLQNALDKRRNYPSIKINAEFSVENMPTLTVTDDGLAIEEDIAKQMFKAALPSSTGLGIGLYHASRQAKYVGYALSLTQNRKGEVCFTLEKAMFN